MYRRLSCSELPEDATVHAQTSRRWLRIYPSARSLHPARRWRQPRAGMKFWLSLVLSWASWAKLGVLGVLGVMGIVEEDRRDNKTFANRPMAGLFSSQAGRVAQIRPPGSALRKPLSGCLVPTPVESCNLTETKREPSRQVAWHAPRDWLTMDDAEGFPCFHWPIWDV